MLDKRILPHKRLWWRDPELPNCRRNPSMSVRKTAMASDRMNSVFLQGLDFKASRNWVGYTQLQSRDIGYIVEVYNLSDIAKHYGLSQNTKVYWRRYILPQPFEISTAANTASLHWSRIQLVVIDTVLKHLEKNGIMSIRRHHNSCLDLIDEGCLFMERIYTEQYERQSTSDFDSFGVRKAGY